MAFYMMILQGNNSSPVPQAADWRAASIGNSELWMSNLSNSSVYSTGFKSGEGEIAQTKV